ncbi:MAG TPA: LytTR family DNA-binding domain-containing protein [Candidatus Acidoferrum sp.]|nr:LytTR family DNA-binding domain-containing protein [Candidatus Acidoferrum sp.]
MDKLRLLVADDEPLIRRGLRNALVTEPGVEVIAECETGAEAVAEILSKRPDLVLLDVQMPDCDGLEVVRQVGPERMPPVIFVTAYDEYAVQAFELNAVDYLLKPFDEKRLGASLGRARERMAAKDFQALAGRLENLVAHGPKPWAERLVVRNNERYDFVPVEKVDWVESANNYVLLHCGQKTHLLGETLTGLEKRLDPGKFVRVHRGRIVNVSRIVAAHAMMNGIYELELNTGARLPTGRQFLGAVQRLLRR